MVDIRRDLGPVLLADLALSCKVQGMRDGTFRAAFVDDIDGRIIAIGTGPTTFAAVDDAIERIERHHVR